MKFLLSAVLLLPALSSVSASYFELVGQESPVKPESPPSKGAQLVPVAPSSGSSSSSSSSSSMASKPAPTLPPKKNILRDNELGAQPVQIADKERDSEKGPSTHARSSGSSFMSSTAPPAPPAKPKVEYASAYDAMDHNDFEAAREFLLGMPKESREAMFSFSRIDWGYDAYLFPSLMALDGYVEAEEYRNLAATLLPHCRKEGNRRTLEAIISLPSQPKPKVEYRNAHDAMDHNDFEAAGEFLLGMSKERRKKMFGFSRIEWGYDAYLFPSLMALNGHVEAEEYRDLAATLLPYCKDEDNRKALEAIISPPSQPKPKVEYESAYDAMHHYDFEAARGFLLGMPKESREAMFSFSRIDWGYDTFLFPSLMALDGYVEAEEYRDLAATLLPHCLKEGNRKTLEAIISPLSQPKPRALTGEKTYVAPSSSGSFSSSSSSSSMASGLVSASSSKPLLRENDLAAQKRVGEPEVGEVGEVEEDEFEPGSTTVPTRPSSGSSMSSSSSPSSSSSSKPEISVNTWRDVYKAIAIDDVETVKQLSHTTTAAVRAQALMSLRPEFVNKATVEVLKSLKGYISSEKLGSHAGRLLDHCTDSEISSALADLILE